MQSRSSSRAASSGTHADAHAADCIWHCPNEPPSACAKGGRQAALRALQALRASDARRGARVGALAAVPAIRIAYNTTPNSMWSILPFMPSWMSVAEN